MSSDDWLAVIMVSLVLAILSSVFAIASSHVPGSDIFTSTWMHIQYISV